MKQENMPKSKNHKASVLAVSLIIMGVMIIIALGISSSSIQSRKSSIGSSKSTVAFQAADSGVEKVMYEIKKGGLTTVDQLSDCLASGYIEVPLKYRIELKDMNKEKINCTDATRLISEIDSVKSIGFHGQDSRAIEAAVGGSACSWETVGVLGSGVSQFNTPRGVSVDSANNKVYIGDGTNSRIARFDSGSGGTTFEANWQTFGGFGSGVGQFNNPDDVFVDSTNNKLYVGDSANSRIASFDSGSGGTTFGQNWQTFGSAGSGINQFNDPDGISIDLTNNKVYVVDSGNSRIVRFDSGSGGTTFGANWQTFGSFGSGAGQFNVPYGDSVDSVNNKVYVADSLNHRIARFDSGSGGTTFGANWSILGSGQGSGAAQFSYPDDVFADSVNNKVYVTDRNNVRIVRFDSGSGGTTFGDNWQTYGSEGSGAGQFKYTDNIFVDLANNKVYVTDHNSAHDNDRVDRFDWDCFSAAVTPPPTFSCQGTGFANASPCPGDNNPSVDTLEDLVANCSSPAGSLPKCEYECVAPATYNAVTDACESACTGGGIVNGLIGYWNMDENSGSNANDTNSNIPANDADITNGSWISGKFDSAVDFDGGSTYAETPEIADPGPYGGLQEGSISAWVNVDTIDNTCVFWGWKNVVASYSSTQGALSYMEWYLGNDFQKFGGNCANDAHNMHIVQEWKTKCAGGPHAILKTVNPIDITSVTGWHLVTFTTNGTTAAEIYWDGVKQPSEFLPGDCSGSPIGNAVDFLNDINNMGDPWYGHFFDIGVLHHGSSFNDYYNGAIDDVRIYDRALDACDVEDLYDYVPPSYSCTGATPANATICSGDDSGLSADTGRTVVSSCTATKCEYTCSSGYTKSGGVCVANCGTLVDARDGKSYDTVQIGSQCWMKQGLNVGTRVNGATQQGTTCTNAADIEKWCYSDDEANCSTNNNPNYPDGGLYQWDQMMCGSTTPGVQGICPSGWHLPTDAEICTMEQTVDASISCSADQWRGTDGGTKLKPNGTSGWEGNLTGGNTYSFPSWFFYNRTTYGYFWSSSEQFSGLPGIFGAWNRELNVSRASVFRNWYGKGNGFSVRCLKGAGISSCTGNGTTAGSGLAGHWKLDDASGTNANDSSSSNNDGTLFNSPAWLTGAIDFDGSNDYISTAANNMYDSFNDGTVTAWARFDNLNPTPNPLGTENVIAEYDTTGTHGSVVGWTAEISSPGFFTLQQELKTPDDPGMWNWIKTDPIPIDSDCHLVAFANDGASRTKIYLDGVEQSTTYIQESGVGDEIDFISDTYGIGSYNHQFNIGARRRGVDPIMEPIGLSRVFRGQIGEVQIYDRALAPGEINNIKNGVAAPSAPLVGHWMLDDGSGITADDASSSGNNGTLTGSPTWTAGLLSGALSLDGVNDYVSVANNSIYDVDPGERRTFSAWFKAGAQTASKYILWNEGSCLGWYVRLDTTGHVRFSYNTGVSGCTGPTNYSVFASDNDYADNQWHLFTGVIDRPNNLMEIFIDGDSKQTIAINNNPGGGAYLKFGTNWNNSVFFTGSIDDVRAYNGALSAAEVLGLYNAGAPSLTVTDNFSRIGPGLGSNWTETASGAFTIVANEVQPSAAGEQAARWSARSFADDQYAQAQVTQVDLDGVQVGIAVRIQTDNSRNYYNLYFDSGQLYFARTDDGAWVDLGQFGAPAVGDILRLEASGNQISAYRNGALLSTVTDSTYSSGSPGLSVYDSSNQLSIDNWEGGDL